MRLELQPQEEVEIFSAEEEDEEREKKENTFEKILLSVGLSVADR